MMADDKALTDDLVHFLNGKGYPARPLYPAKNGLSYAGFCLNGQSVAFASAAGFPMEKITKPLALRRCEQIAAA